MKERLSLKDILFLVVSCIPGCQGLWCCEHRSAAVTLMRVVYTSLSIQYHCSFRGWISNSDQPLLSVQMFPGVNPCLSVMRWKSFGLKSKQHLKKQLMFLSLFWPVLVWLFFKYEICSDWLLVPCVLSSRRIFTASSYQLQNQCRFIAERLTDV